MASDPKVYTFEEDVAKHNFGFRSKVEDVDFCPTTIDGTSDQDPLRQRFEHVSGQRVELQREEIELQAQMIARSKIMEIQNNFEEQLHDREQTILELERKMEEKDRELHAIKLDNEAAWAKDDLLREQNKELANFRREPDPTEAERAQHIQQLRDLQEHIQEKERQLIELQEQHRLAQETILYKDEQLREAQIWITHVQEMDVLQSNQLQAELRERTEQYNQLWLGCQRQASEQNVQISTGHGLEGQVLTAEQRSSAANLSKSDTSIPSVYLKESTINNATSAVLSESFVSTGHTNAVAVGNTSETALLDERALLACIIRTIPADGRIHITFRLQRRLETMIPPLHWRDYKKKYGKLVDFLTSHTELFVIKADCVQLRDGAQEMITATAAVAKVAAESVKQSQQLNGVSNGVPGGFSNVKILSKSNCSEAKPSQSSVHVNGANGAVSTESSGLTNGRQRLNFLTEEQQSSGLTQRLNFLTEEQQRLTTPVFPSRR